MAKLFVVVVYSDDDRASEVGKKCRQLDGRDVLQRKTTERQS